MAKWIGFKKHCPICGDIIKWEGLYCDNNGNFVPDSGKRLCTCEQDSIRREEAAVMQKYRYKHRRMLQSGKGISK